MSFDEDHHVSPYRAGDVSTDLWNSRYLRDGDNESIVDSLGITRVTILRVAETTICHASSMRVNLPARSSTTDTTRL